MTAWCRKSVGKAPPKVLQAGIYGLLGLLLFAGCGRSHGPDRYRLSGTVQFDGKPVHSGRVTLVPDSTKGNAGPAGFASIENGRFDTALDGSGSVGGAMVVSIDAYSVELITVMDGGLERQIPKRLVSGYEERIDLPQEIATHSFEIPASAGQKPRR